MSNLDDPEWVEVFAEFAEESREALARAEEQLIAMERERMLGHPVDAEVVSDLFRTFHTVKGTAGFLALEQIVGVAHVSENILSGVREGRIEPQSPHVTALCEAVDFLVQGIGHVGRTGEDGPLAGRATALHERLTALELGIAAPATAEEVTPEEEETAAVEETDEPIAAEEEVVEEAPVEEEVAPEDEVSGEKEIAPEPPAREEAKGAPLAPPPAQLPPASAKPPAKPAARPATPTSGQRAEEGAVAHGEREVIRVDAARVDALLNMVGELVIAENMTRRELGEALEGSRGLLSLRRVTRQLQDITMSIRMIPVRGAFRKMHRLVRDLTHKQGKLTRLVVLGEDTEVDKSLVDALGDPLVHILRNSIDHGLETPDVRRRSGKAEEGTIVLEAGHQGGEVVIAVSDDGRGLDREAILRRAVERGLVPADREMSDAEVHQLLFEPGFSTAAQVTDVSGRGVGMDVVRRRVESFNGRVQITSTPGQGTRITLRVPLTLAIVDGMLVRVGDQIYTAPMVQVRESIPLAETTVTDLPEGTELVELRGRFVPFIRLTQLFGQGEREAGKHAIVVFLEGSDGVVGVLVDEVLGQQQTVIKPLPPLLAHARAVSGCCILGDGRVALILDGNSLSALGRMGGRSVRGGKAA
ncbi:MAG: chemotaxis protein CheA [Myxococcales bacterium]|nr:chemotaxis protein CheA [Myxococcales bacterium]